MLNTRLTRKFSEIGFGLTAVAVLFLAGCGGGSSAPPPPTFLFTSNSGTAKALDGTWIACYTSGQRDVLTIAGASVTMNTYTGGTASTATPSSTVLPNCSGGTVDPAQAITATMTGTAVSTPLLTWEDGFGNTATAPAGVTGPTAFNSYHVSAFSQGGTAIVPVPGGTIGWFVDDTGPVQILYRTSSKGIGTSGCSVAADTPEKCLGTADPYYK